MGRNEPWFALNSTRVFSWTRYEIEPKQIGSWIGSDAIQERFTAQLEERHQREREPCVRLPPAFYEAMTIMELRRRLILLPHTERLEYDGRAGRALTGGEP
jgi:hypothetical protein